MTTAAAVVSFITAAGAMTNADIRDSALSFLEPTPPPIVPVSTELARFPDDGLHRLVVTPLEGSESMWSSGAEDLPDVRFGHPAIDAVAAQRVVQSVRAIGDGSFSVVTADPGVLDPGLFDIVEDVPMVTTEEPHQGFQWAVENDGENLRRVGTGGTPQIADVDVDWTMAMGEANGEKVVVAVIDSGIDSSHPDLTGALWTNDDERCGNDVDDDGNGYVDDCWGWDFGNHDNKPWDQVNNSHGTHVAGVIGARVNEKGVAGVAPLVTLMDLSVEQRSSYGTSISLSSVAAAVRYAADNGAHIVNLSLGTSPGTDAASVQVLGDAIDYAGLHGVIVVVSAGNNGVNLDSTAIYPASFGRPNMVVVGSSGPTDERSSFSNYSPSLVDVFAPGELILSTTPLGEYQFMSGTSQAAPMVTGVLALVRSSDETLAPSAVVQQVLDGAEAVEALSTYAAGGARVNAAGALGVVGATSGNGGSVRQPSLSITGLDAIERLGGGTFAVDTTVGFDVPSEAYDEPFHWELALVAESEQGPAALLDYPVRLDGQTATTGSTGSLRLAEAETQAVRLQTTLPEGRYALVIEAVVSADPEQRLGAPLVASFEIDAEAVAAAATSTSTSTNPPTTAPPSTASPTTLNPVGEDMADGDSGAMAATEEAAPAPTTAPTDASVQYQSTGESVGEEQPWWVDWQPIGAGRDQAADETTPTTQQWWAAPTTDMTDAEMDYASTDPEMTTSTTATPRPTAPPGTPNEPNPALDPTAEAGDWSITGFSSQIGFVNSTAYLTINGTFPEDVYVWFGDRPGTVVSQRSRNLTVLSPSVATPGVVDVTLRSTGDEVLLTVPDAYAFWLLDSDEAWYEAPEATSSSTTPASAPTTAMAEPAASDSTLESSTDESSTDEGSTEEGSTDEADTAESSAEAAPHSDLRQSRAKLGTPFRLGNGLTGALLDRDPYDHAVPCSTPICVVRQA
ncbi:MAG: S8 family serine peptidase [Acidimicrobiales bacterium]